MRSQKYIILVVAVLMLNIISSCGGKRSGNKSDGEMGLTTSENFDYPVTFEYAKGLDVINGDGYKIVHVFHPDVPDTIDTYVLYPKDHRRPHLEGVKVNAYISVPITKIACTSSVQVGALPLLDREDHLVGVVSTHNVNNAKVRALVDKGQIHNVGRGMSKNMEMIISLQPDVLLMDFTRTPEEDEKFKDSGVNVLLYNSWKERDLLGRAEWLKFIGMLFGDNIKAAELFQQIASDYNEVKELVAKEDDVIPVMYGLDFKGTWYLPGEYSYVTAMFRDAKLSYDYAEGRVSSLPTSFERVFKNNRDAKVWICMMAGDISTVDEFIAQNDRYRHFGATKEGGKVVIDRKRVNEYGGNDYWESGPYRPDLILKDLIKVTRPYLLPDYETTYFIELSR